MQQELFVYYGVLEPNICVRSFFAGSEQLHFCFLRFTLLDLIFFPSYHGARGKKKVRDRLRNTAQEIVQQIQ